MDNSHYWEAAQNWKSRFEDNIFIRRNDMKERINVLDYAGTILNAVKKGVLLTVKADDKVNSMTISWGTLGIE